MKTGVIGLGDMGSGLAKNLMANGFETSGFDLSDKRMADFAGMGGVAGAGAGAYTQLRAPQTYCRISYAVWCL